MGRSMRGWMIAGLAIAAGPAALEATVLLPADLTELVRESRAVVHGRVIDVRSEWADGRRRIDSLVTVEAFDYFKGDFGPQVTFRVPGGQIGRYRSVTVGAPVFHAGEEVVLFLSARGPSIPWVLGLGQGVFRVVTDSRSSDRLVTPPALVAGATTEAVRRGAASRRPVPLAEFGDSVRRLAAGLGGDR